MRLAKRIAYLSVHGASIAAISRFIMAEDRPTSQPLTVDVVVEPEAEATLRSLRGFSSGDTWWRPYALTLGDLWQAERPGCGGQIGIIFVGTERIHTLNRDYRSVDRPTDVLTFDLSDAPDSIEGEVYIGVDVADSQAGKWNNALDEELARLMVHGALHLAGHDHHTPADGRRMADATRRWLAVWRDYADSSASSEKE